MKKLIFMCKIVGLPLFEAAAEAERSLFKMLNGTNKLLPIFLFWGFTSMDKNIRIVMYMWGHSIQMILFWTDDELNVSPSWDNSWSRGKIHCWKDGGQLVKTWNETNILITALWGHPRSLSHKVSWYLIGDAPYLPCQWRRVGPVSSQCTSPQLYPRTPVDAHTLYLLQIPQAKQTHLAYCASATKEEGKHRTAITQAEHTHIIFIH